MKRVFMLLPILLGACREEQSALHPRGEQAGRIAELAWILFGGGTAILLLVLAAVWLAIRGGPDLRRRLASPTVIMAGGIAFPVVTLTVLLGYGLWLMRTDQREHAAEPAHRIEVSGEQWWWRVAYLDAAGQRIAAANEIRMPVGREVAFVLTSPDVIHSFWIPALGGKVDMIPGRTTHLRLRAERAGTYRGQCAEYCGGPHALMALPVIALPPADFDAWLAAQAAPAVPSEAQREGARLFSAAGCGACHAVRGTVAAGRIGPDLTHIGSRPSVGIDTLAMTRENVARFITHGQHIKPGNPMPPFAVLADAERDAIADYLLSLR